MAQLLGMYHSKKPRCLQGIYDAPYIMTGRNVLCGVGCAAGDGLTALAVGWARNADALRDEIRASGLPVPDASLSTLLLSAYRLWGEECVLKIEGPVISAVIDQNRDRLLLAADRMGEAGSLFYTAQGDSVSFAGHPEPLLSAPDVNRIADAEGLRGLLGLGPARIPGRTPFRDIKSLPAGHLLVMDSDGLRIQKYFSITARPHEDSIDETVDRVRHLTTQAVSDAARFHPVAMLSGGLDSTVLTALLAEQSSFPVRTFSVDYEENDAHFQGGSYQPEQDAPYAQMAVKAIGTDHTRVVLRIESLVDSLSDAVAARGFPGMADIDSSLLLFSKHIAGEAKYVLSGECGDEVFGGYPWFNREELIQKDGFPWSGSLALRSRVVKPELRKLLALDEYVDSCWRETLARQPVLPGETAREAKLRQLQGVCFEYFMANLQERASAMGAAAGLTVLTPFCDDRLAQYVYNVPWSVKALGGQEKGLLRTAMQHLLPGELVWRKKSPYPKTYHPLYTQLVIEALKSILADDASPILQIIDREAVTQLMNGELSPAATPWFGQLMSGPQMLAYLIQVNQWMMKYRVEIEGR